VTPGVVKYQDKGVMVSSTKIIASVLVVYAIQFASAAAPVHAIAGGSSRHALFAGQRCFLVADAAKSSSAAAPSFDLGKTAKSILASTKDFFLGAASGGFASLLVFPIDLAKTRIQDQKIVAGAELVYKNAFQTIFKVATTEGFPALYNGVAPVLIGAAPESALQIGMNDKAKAYFARSVS
jgi:hypothetical protein